MSIVDAEGETSKVDVLGGGILCAASDGKRIVTQSEKGRKRCWNAIKGQEIDPCTDPPPPEGQTEAVSPDGRLRIRLSRGIHAEIYVVRND